MPSFRARMTNALLRLTVKTLWRPGLAIDTLRVHAAKSDARLSRGTPDCPVEAIEIAGRPAHWFGAPDLAARNGTLLYLHGGAWCLHLPRLYAGFAAALSNATGLRVLLVDYRLAPEHPFPAAIDDCLATYRAMLEGPHGGPVAIAGDSAGGSLSLVTLMRARDAGLPLPACAVLLSPSTDLAFGGPSIRYNADADPMFSAASMGLLPDIYCPAQDCGNPLLSPLYGDWSGLPPLYFLAGSTEMLLDDSVRAHDRAQQAGTSSRIDVWWQMPHVFPVIRLLPEARVALEAIRTFVEEHGARPPRSTRPLSRARCRLEQTGHRPRSPCRTRRLISCRSCPLRHVRARTVRSLDARALSSTFPDGLAASSTSRRTRAMPRRIMRIEAAAACDRSAIRERTSPTHDDAATVAQVRHAHQPRAERQCRVRHAAIALASKRSPLAVLWLLNAWQYQEMFLGYGCVACEPAHCADTRCPPRLHQRRRSSAHTRRTPRARRLPARARGAGVDSGRREERTHRGRSLVGSGESGWEVGDAGLRGQRSEPDR